MVPFMRNGVIKWCFFVSGVFVILTAKAHSLEHQFSLQMDEFVYLESNLLNEIQPRFEQEEVYNVLRLYPGFSFSAGNFVGGSVVADIYWRHSRDTEQEDAIDPELMEAFLVFFSDTISVQVGLQPFRVGRGLITDSREPGIMIDYQMTKKISGKVGVAQIVESSPMVMAGVEYQIDFLEKVEVFGIFYKDEDNLVAGLLNRSSYLNVVSSTGDFFWCGTNMELFIWNYYITGSAIYEFGTTELVFEDRSIKRSIDLSSYLIDLGVDYSLNKLISAGAFIFVTGGDRHPLQDELGVFISPMPYNLRGAIFFQEFGRQETQDSLLPAGVTAYGVIAPGVRIDYQPVENLSVGMTLSFFFPEKDPPDHQDYYGWESDVILSYGIHKNMTLFFEADYFQHGDFFKTTQGNRPEPARRVVAGFSVFL